MEEKEENCVEEKVLKESKKKSKPKENLKEDEEKDKLREEMRKRMLSDSWILMEELLVRIEEDEDEEMLEGMDDYEGRDEPKPKRPKSSMNNDINTEETICASALIDDKRNPTYYTKNIGGAVCASALVDLMACGGDNWTGRSADHTGPIRKQPAEQSGGGSSGTSEQTGPGDYLN